MTQLRYEKRRAELLLTVGRILRYLGLALVVVPVACLLPGLALMIAGREMFLHGEDTWNALHRLPKKWRG